MGFTAIPFDWIVPDRCAPNFLVNGRSLVPWESRTAFHGLTFHNSRFGQNCYSAVLFRTAIREPHAPPTDPFRFRAESHRSLFAGRARRQHAVFVRADAARSGDQIGRA